MHRYSLPLRNTLVLPKVNYLVLAVLSLILVHVSIHLVLNEVIRKGDFEHPDSAFYDAHAESLANRWREGEVTLVRYPEFANVQAIFYFIFNNNSQSIRFVNILVHVLTAVIAYLTVKNITRNKYAPWLALFLVGLNPYQTYLSTQILKDSWLILGTAIVLYAATARTKRQYVIAGFLGTLILAFLRLEYSAILLTIVTPYIIWQVARGKLAKLMMIGAGAIAIAIVLFIFDNDITGSAKGVNANAVLAARVALRPPEWVKGQSHIEFFDPRPLPAIRNPICTKLTNLYKCSTLLLGTLSDAFFLPHPWKANTSVEIAFGVAQVWWYFLIFLSFLGLLTVRSKTTLLLVLLFLALAFPLGTGITKPSAYLRWRSPPDYILMIAMSLSIVNLIYYKHMKRLLDLFMSIVILLIMTPLIAIISLTLIWNRQPIIFKQERVGLGRKRITIYKFTTMAPDNDSPEAGAPPGMAKYTKGMKITKLGKLLRPSALDEIPQLINVLKGEISLVGPRALNRHLDRLCSEIPHWNDRYSVLPGLVGLAAFNADRLDNVERIKWDLEYISQASIILDIQLIYRGIMANFRRKWK